MTTPESPAKSPTVSELERLIEANSTERSELLEQEWSLRQQLQAIIGRRQPATDFEAVRASEREARAALNRNLEQYDVLVEKWAAEGMKI